MSCFAFRPMSMRFTHISSLVCTIFFLLSVFVYIQCHVHIYGRHFFRFSLVTYSTSSGATNALDMS